MSNSAGTHVPSSAAMELYTAHDRLRSVISAVEAVENLPLKASNIIDIELDLRECLREVAHRLGEVADGRIGGGLLRLVRIEPGHHQVVEVTGDLHDSSSRSVDSDVAASVVDTPTVEADAPDAVKLSAPVSGAPRIVTLEQWSRTGPDGDDKDVDVITAVLISETSDIFTVRELGPTVSLPKEQRPYHGGWLRGHRV